jgi:predicted ArsR family transcriptional regulator
MTNETQMTRGRRPIFSNKNALTDVLEMISQNSFKSRYLSLKLIEMGLVEAVGEKTVMRGRPRVNYRLTGKGRGRLAIGRNWRPKNLLAD